jgi:hypothetical protein
MQDRFVGDIGDYLKLSILHHQSLEYHFGALLSVSLGQARVQHSDPCH